MDSNVAEKEIVYLSLIGECFKLTSDIQHKVNFISSGSGVSSKTLEETPSRTELESRLKNLVSELKAINNNLVI